MPLTPAYEWAETAGGVSVRVRWTGVGRQGVDVLAADCYVKVGGPPPPPSRAALTGDAAVPLGLETGTGGPARTGRALTRPSRPSRPPRPPRPPPGRTIGPA